MKLAELALIGMGLSMDAFAVAVCKGLSLGKTKWAQGLVVGGYFGLFQAIMPILGYFLGGAFADHISAVDHWIVFILLEIIGGKMIYEAKREEQVDCSLKVRSMLLLAVSTSIDALAIGISFSFLSVNIWASASVIGLMTFALSAIGLKIGSIFGARCKSKAELAGGLILMLMGVKILLEHMEVLHF